MKRTFLAVSACILLLTPYAASARLLTPALAADRADGAPVAGAVPLAGSAADMGAVIGGWSAKKAILGKNVKNDAKENLGTIEDVIITPNNAASFAIIGVGGFLGIAQRKVAIPMHDIELKDGEWVLAGATKDALKAMPPFVYAR